jgi:methyl-accepting chemotaxis protein
MFDKLKIGLRLGLGFGVILLAFSALLVGALISTGASRNTVLETLQLAADQKKLAEEMRRDLLSSSVSVRNMGLQTKVDAVQRDEQEAKRRFAAYLAAKDKLDVKGMGDRERALLADLTSIGGQMNALFQEAVDLASQFNTEESTAIITDKIDPLLTRAMAVLAEFISLQEKRANAATQLANANAVTTSTVIAGVGVLLFLLAGLMAWSLTRSITSPLKTALVATQKIAEGNLLIDIPAGTTDSREETKLLLQGLLAMRDGLSRIVSEVRIGAENISTGANEIASGNLDLSHRTETQASHLQETAASMQDLSNNVRVNAETAHQASQMASSASAAATLGGEVMQKVVATMDEITVASRKIEDIIGVIDGIAFQTNILALNAAVEAARAGEQGRGFAVVAGEVRSLAGRSATAAKEIKELIGASVGKVAAGTKLVGTAGKSMNDIVTQVKRVADLIGEISGSAQTQTEGIEQVNQSVSQLDIVTQQNAALVEQAAAAADSLNQQAGRMVSVVSTFILDSAVAQGAERKSLPPPMTISGRLSR